MLNSFFQHMWHAMGFHVFTLVSLFHMIVRGIIIYLFGITLARFNKKLLGIRTPFNFMLFVMLGSISANAVVFEELFLPILGTILFLTLLNGLITALAYYFPSIEFFVKGTDAVLVKNGKIQWSAMRNNLITEREVINELQTQLHTSSLEEVATATLASDGTINFIRKKP